MDEKEPDLVSAEDLNAIPVLGKLIIFLRGMQRPFWGFGVFYLDNRWFFSVDEFTDRQEITLLVINLLVLGFLFGERALKNLMPLFTKLLEAKKTE